MMYSIIELRDGTYQCICRAQDGTERWTEKDKDTAVEELINAAKALNGTKITEKDIHFEPHIPHFASSQPSPLSTVMQAVDAEYRRATILHGSMSSTHEGYAIIQEEVDELWEGVKRNDSHKLLKEEAVQIAAMAIRFCIDI